MLPKIKGSDRVNVFNYQDFIQLAKSNTHLNRVAIIGAGGIGVDIATMLTEAPDKQGLDWFAEWGIDKTLSARAGLIARAKPKQTKQVWLLQRKQGKIGKGPGKTTGWLHRALLKQRGVTMLAGVNYLHIDDAGLHIEYQGQYQLIAAEQIVFCTGQQAQNTLATSLSKQNIAFDLIGGAKEAKNIDAKRAIREGIELALSL